MAYATAADFREESLAEYCAQFTLSEAEASTTNLTAAIARTEPIVDVLLNDHFEVEDNMTLQLEGDGSKFLYIPKRIRAIDSVTTTDEDGAATTQATTTYRAIKSLNAAFTASVNKYDWLMVIDDLVDTPHSLRWPTMPGSVTVVGDFSWAAVPADVKRLTAIIVYDHFKPQGESLGRANRWQTVGGTIYERPEETQTGLPEADAIIARMRKPDPYA